MPNIIVNSGYIKSSAHFLNYLTYAGEKLEAQELIFANGRMQEVSADQIVDTSDPDIASVRITYKDGQQKTMRPAAYTRHIKDQQTDTILVVVDGTERPLDPEQYIQYIAHRPSVERNENRSHGLFGINGPVDIAAAEAMARQYDSHIKWAHIISLTREGAEHTGFDHRQSWETLIRAKALDIAKIYNISPDNLVLHAAFHKMNCQVKCATSCRKT